MNFVGLGPENQNNDRGSSQSGKFTKPNNNLTQDIILLIIIEQLSLRLCNPAKKYRQNKII